jgi:signal transduction histidine kinase
MDRSQKLEGWQQALREWWIAFEDFATEYVGWAGEGVTAFNTWVNKQPLALRWIAVAGSVLLASALGIVFRGSLTIGSQLMLFLPAVLLSRVYGGNAGGAFAGLLGAAVTMLLYPLHFVSLLLYGLACWMVIALARAQDRSREEAMRLTRLLERRVAEEAAQAKAANDELAGFCYSISHDLRAPMRHIVGSSQILLREYEELPEEVRQRLENLAYNANRLSDLVDDLLGYARLGQMPLHKDRIDVTRLADTLCRRMRQEQGAFSSMQSRVEPGLLVCGDKELVGVVLRQLVENACKYAKPGELLRVEVGETRRRGHLWLYVRDNGIGFDMQYAPKVFQPFQRLHRDTEYIGTGIGLAYVQRIVERHGGEVEVESAPGKGTTFYFHFGDPPAATGERQAILAEDG